MKVTMITSTFLPNVGGAEMCIFHLSRALTDHGVDVEIITPRVRGHLLHSGDSSLFIKMLKVKYLPLTPKFSFCLLLFALCKYAAKSDVIHAHFLYPAGLAAVLYKVLSRKPCVVTAHGVDILINESIGYGMRLNKAYDLMIKFALKSADAVIAPSRLVAEEAIKAGAPASKIHIIPNGVDIEKFSSDRVNANTAKDMLGLNTTEHVVLIVANFRPVKGYRFLVEAIPLILKDVPKTVFLFIGDGPEKPKIVRRIKELGVSDKAIFVGSVSPELMPLYYAAADIFVLPSISENFPLTVLEAMSSGKPIVATSTGAIPELVHEGVSGIVVKPMDSAALAKAIIKFLMDPSLRENAGRLSREIAKKYDWNVIAEKTLSLYNELLEK